jgi:hydroxyethylthiazole kinase-like uncharacterized protein yjeF
MLTTSYPASSSRLSGIEKYISSPQRLTCPFRGNTSQIASAVPVVVGSASASISPGVILVFFPMLAIPGIGVLYYMNLVSISRKGVKMKVAKAAEMKELDRRAMEEFGISQDLLMENAGQAVYFVISQELGINNNKFVIFCGGGNNGGDGLVAARKLHSHGGEVKVFLLDDEAKFRGAARKNFEIVSRMQIEISRIISIDSIVSEVLDCDAVVDAIFGTGLVREVSGIYRDVIQLINENLSTVFSVDIPSGINGDTGHVMGVAVEADYTVTFGLPKVGNMLYPGYEYCGQLHVSHISFPPALYSTDSIKVAVNNLCCSIFSQGRRRALLPGNTQIYFTIHSQQRKRDCFSSSKGNTFR